MDRALNPRLEKETIYEIYRGCRLCGAGAGYKMPIIQNVINLEDSGLNLSQKIRETIQIEVHQDDKMPPLICELCVDKVNDFYEFLEMCHRTNKRTRMKLGLPLQTTTKASANQPEANDCILGDTAPIYINDDSDGEPLVKNKTKPKDKQRDKSLKVKGPEIRIKIENYPKETKFTRSSRIKRSLTPVRVTRLGNSTQNKNGTTNKLQELQPKASRPAPKSVKKEMVSDIMKIEHENSLLTPRLKRPREKDVKIEVPTKKTKVPTEAPKQSSKSSPKEPKHPQKTSITPAKVSTPPSRAAKRPATPTVLAKRTASPARSTKRSSSPKSAREVESPTFQYKCLICRATLKNVKSFSNHMRLHTVTFTSSKLACNACGEWFSNSDEVSSHHRRHRCHSLPYRCRRCTADFMHQQAYDSHFDNKQCIPWDVVPDVRCKECWRYFATDNLLIEHKCGGEDGRPGGKCIHCNRTYILLRNLKKHESTCMHKKESKLVVDPEVLARLRPARVRVARCDALLRRGTHEHCDVSTVTADFGLDRNSVYPYMSSVRDIQIKTEPCVMEYDSMVTIKEEMKEEFCSEEQYVHWDSDSSDNDTEVDSGSVLNPFANRKTVDSLGTLTLKTLFSQKCLGKVPKRRRKVKSEAFDSMLNDSELDIRKDIDNIIDNLDSDVDKSINVMGGDRDLSSVKEDLQNVDRMRGFTTNNNGGFEDDKNGDVSDADSYSLLDDTQSYTDDKSEKQCNYDRKVIEITTNDNFVHNNDKINENAINHDDSSDVNNDQSTSSSDNFDKFIQNDMDKFKKVDEDTNSFKDVEAFIDIRLTKAVVGKSPGRNENSETHNHNGTLILDEVMNIKNISSHVNGTKNINVNKSIREQESEMHDDTRKQEVENDYSSQETPMSVEQCESETKNNKIINDDPNDESCNQHNVGVHKINETITKDNNLNAPLDSSMSPTILSDVKIDSIKNNELIKEKSENTDIKYGTVNINKGATSENGVAELGSDGLEDISEGEMDDMMLMKELDAQIGETDDRNTNSNVNNERSNESCNVSERNDEYNASDNENTNENENNDRSNEDCDSERNNDYNVSSRDSEKLNENRQVFERSNEVLNENCNVSKHITENHNAPDKNERFGDDSVKRNIEHHYTSKDLIDEIKDKAENTMSHNENSSHINERQDIGNKVTLEDLLTTRDNGMRSMDLDNISDNEFNFDI